MNNDELIEYAIRTSKTIKEEVKPKLIDYFYKQKEVIDKANKYIKEKQKIQYKFALSHIECDDLLDILNEVSE